MSDRANEIMQGAVRSAAVENLRKAIADPEAAELLLLLARHRKMQFDAHVKAGFTPEQALQLAMKA